MDAIPGTYRAFRSRLDPRSSVLDTYVCVRMHGLGPNLISCFAFSPGLRLLHSRSLLLFICRSVSLSLFLCPRFSLFSVFLFTSVAHCVHRTTLASSHKHTSLMFTGCGTADCTAVQRAYSCEHLKSAFNRNACTLFARRAIIRVARYRQL